MRTIRPLPRKSVDRSDIVAYGCAGAAIAFIAAVTFGAVGAPPQRQYVQGDGASVVAAASPAQSPQTSLR